MKDDMQEQIRQAFERLSPKDQAEILAEIEHLKRPAPTNKALNGRHSSGEQQAFAKRIYSRDRIVLIATDSERVWKTHSGKAIGISYASERRPGRWFLGLPHRDYAAIVLLCQAGNTILEFVLPDRFLSKHARDFDRSRDFKYNIALVSRCYQIMLPASGVRVSIDEFLGRLDILTLIT
jgi:hypothetical protein